MKLDVSSLDGVKAGSVTLSDLIFGLVPREDLIARLFKMKHKHEQYRHLDIHQIYSNESKLRL